MQKLVRGTGFEPEVPSFGGGGLFTSCPHRLDVRNNQDELMIADSVLFCCSAL